MNWEVFWSFLFALLVALSIFTLVFTRHRDRLLRITLADYEDFLQGERYVQECKDEEARKADDRSPDEYFEARRVIRGLHLEYRQSFTGEDFSAEIAEGKRLQEKFMGEKE